MCYNASMKEINRLSPEEAAPICSAHPPACVSRAMSLIGDMWTLVIVYNLMSGPKRFGELLEAMGNVSPKTVSQRLKMLEQKGFVERHAFAEIPPRVEYHLLEKGYALMEVIDAIRLFGERYLADDEDTTPSPSIPDQVGH